MDHVAMALAHKPGERGRAAQHHERIVARDIERNEFAARSRHVSNKTTRARDDGNVMAGCGKDAYQFDSAGIGGANIECRYDDQCSH